MPPPLLTLEEHFFSTPLPPSYTARYAEQLRHVPDLLPKLTDLGALRRRDMDAGDISLQVISHAPGLGEHGAAACRRANVQLAGAIRAEEERVVAEGGGGGGGGGGGDRNRKGKARGRFAGFAVLPMGDPIEAAA
jgi:predicted TIM-barrel fold metal-dependent hydrolase